MTDGVRPEEAITAEVAVQLAKNWARAHHADAKRSARFALEWCRERKPEDRQGEVLLRDLAFFFQAASHDAAYWRSIGEFTEEATGAWGARR